MIIGIHIEIRPTEYLLLICFGVQTKVATIDIMGGGMGRTGVRPFFPNKLTPTPN